MLVSIHQQARNLEFFRVGKFSWNWWTSINNHVQHEKERPRREKIQFFLLETLKNCISNEKFNPRINIIRAFFFQNEGFFLQLLKKDRVDLSSLPYSYAWSALVTSSDLFALKKPFWITSWLLLRHYYYCHYVEYVWSITRKKDFNASGTPFIVHFTTLHSLPLVLEKDIIFLIFNYVHYAMFLPKKEKNISTLRSRRNGHKSFFSLLY